MVVFWCVVTEEEDEATVLKLRFGLAGEPGDDFVVGRGFDGYCLLDKTIKQLATTGGLSAVEAERELVKVVTKVLVADCALMGPHQPPFQE